MRSMAGIKKCDWPVAKEFVSTAVSVRAPSYPHLNVGRCALPAADHVMVAVGVHGTKINIEMGVKGATNKGYCSLLS